MITKKDILINREGDLKTFFELVPKFIEENIIHFSSQDLTRIVLGVAMSVVDKVPNPNRTRELLGTVRRWTQGRISDEDVEKAEEGLWKLYHATLSAAGCCALAVGDASREPASRYSVTCAISDALRAGARSQEIVDSIERETGPLDWFLTSRGM